MTVAHYHGSRGRGRTAVLLLALAGCIDTTSIALPPIDDGIQTIVLVASRPNGRTVDTFYAEVFAVSDALTWPRGLPGDVVLTVLYYREALAALGFTPGPLKLADSSTRVPRFLPDAEERWGLVLPGAATWSALTREQVPSVQIEGFLPEECITNADACWSAEACVIPCDAPAPIAAPAAPALPTPPTDGPCPNGWTLSAPTELGATLCAPDYLDVTCPIGQVPTFDDATCAPVGSTCPVGQYPDGVEAMGRPVVWVLPGALGGDGSLGAPAGTLVEALSLAPDGAVVALARGTYAATATLSARRELSIVGACASDTELDGALTIVGSSGIELRDVHLRGPSTAAALRVRESVASLEGVWIEGPWTGLELRTSTVTVARSLITGQRDVAGNSGVIAYLGSVVTLDRVAIDDAGGVAARILGAGTRASMTRVSIRRARDVGIIVSSASLGAEALVVEDSVRSAIHVAHRGRVSLDRAVLRGNSELPRPGLTVTTTSSADLRHTWLVDHSPSHLTLLEGSSASITESILSGQGPAIGGLLTPSVAVWRGALTLERVTVERYGGTGLDVNQGDPRRHGCGDVGLCEHRDVCGVAMDLRNVESRLTRVRVLRARGHAITLYNASDDGAVAGSDGRGHRAPRRRGGAGPRRCSYARSGGLTLERAAILRSTVAAFDCDGNGPPDHDQRPRDRRRRRRRSLRAQRSQGHSPVASAPRPCSGRDRGRRGPLRHDRRARRRRPRRRGRRRDDGDGDERTRLDRRGPRRCRYLHPERDAILDPQRRRVRDVRGRRRRASHRWPHRRRRHRVSSSSETHAPRRCSSAYAWAPASDSRSPESEMSRG
jgi:hypothetical protein